VPVLMATLGKAIGTFGAFVAGSDALIETLVQRARTYIYYDRVAAGRSAATREALAIAATEEWRRERLREPRRANFAPARERTRARACMPSSSPIQPLVLGTRRRRSGQRVVVRGRRLGAGDPPAHGAAGTSRLRITFSAAHAASDVDSPARRARRSWLVVTRADEPARRRARPWRDLVLLHGWALHGETWGPWLEELGRTPRLHVVDLPGHGLSPWPDVRLRSCRPREAVARCVPADAALLGWSLGGMVALEIARCAARNVPGSYSSRPRPSSSPTAPGRTACRRAARRSSADACATTTTGRSRTSSRCRRAATSARLETLRTCVARWRGRPAPPSRRSTRARNPATCGPARRRR
jgi:hypothetical protein